MPNGSKSRNPSRLQCSTSRNAASARSLASPRTALTGAAVDTVLGEASDRAEAALRLVLHWSREGFRDFEPFGIWFFRFAASLYAEYQPQFLGEFVMEHLRTGYSSVNLALVETWRDQATKA